MKLSKLLLPFLLAFSLVEITVSAQTSTYMPDDNFEAWCEFHGYGDNIPNNDSISTINASFATLLPIDNVVISDLTGIMAFTGLTSLNCANNNLSSIDISFLGNNLTYLNVMGNPNLYCITVSDTAYAANNLAFFEESFTSYSTDCSTAFGCMDPLSCYYEPTHSIDTAAGGSCFFSVDTNLTADVCDSYLFGGLNRYTSGTYIDVLTTVDGCDSNVILSLIIRNSTASYDTTSVLVCDSFIWNNLLINGSGNFVFNAGLNAAGCDSTAYLTAIIEYSNTSSYNVTSCDTYSWNGTVYASSGTYEYLTTNAAGCDSTATLNLTIDNSSTSITSITSCDTSSWNGQLYTVSGVYNFVTTNAAGCDSTATLNLTITNAVSSYVALTECNSYMWPKNGVTYSVSGLYVFSSITSSGCVNVDSLNLTITNSTTSTDTQVHCDSYTWLDGITYTSSNSTATFTSTNAAGCTNTATLDLTIKNSTSGSLDTIVCSLYTDPLANNYDTTAIYTFVLTNAIGCDSIVTLNLTVNYPDNSLTTITECDSYTWNGTTYTTTDIYSFNLQTVAGCDSVAVLDLFIGYNEVNTTTVTTCDNYEWLDANGNVIITALNSDITLSGTGVGNYGLDGVYIDTVNYTNQGGCDSIEILNLTITSNVVSSSQAIDIFECGSWMGPDGIYYTTSVLDALVIGTTAGGCDSIQDFNINIATEKKSDENVISCDSYFWPVNGVTYTSSTLDSVVYYVTHTFPSLDTITCDSVAYLHLTINNSKYSTDTQVHCDSYIWPVNGFTYTSSNSTDSVILQTVNNCDSIVYLDLIINNSATVTTDTQVHCDSYTWIDGNTYSVSVNASSAYTNTTATYMLQTIDGCDSLIVLDLTIHPSYSDTLNPVISCDSYYWDLGTPLAAAVTYYTSGLYSVLFASQHGCDSLILLDLTIDNSHSYTDTQVHCDSYSWIDGNTYTASNSTAIYIYQTVVGGCDSIIYLDLTINYSNTGASSVTECDSYTWDGMTYTTSGAYYNTYTNVAGCDSVYTLNLTINYSNTGTSSETECDSYTWDGMTYTTSGAYYNTYTNVAGCDSVHTLNLIIDNTVVNHDTIITCYEYTWQPALYLGSTSYWTFDTSSTFNAGVNSLTHTVYGNSINPISVCTDISKLYLTINPLEYGSYVAVACDSYLWEGNIYDTSGVYVDTIQGSLCDSIVTLNLTIDYSTSSTDNVGVHCDSYTWLDGITYTSSNNTATWTYTNAADCDSTVTLDLTINNSSDSIITEIACDSFYWSITDTIYYTSGAHTYTMFGGNSVGCDSTVWLYLTINNSTTSIDTQLHCDSYTWIDGITYTSSNNTATWTYPNAAGCDNLATLDLTINSSTTSIDTQLHCDSYTWIDGITYTSSNNTATWTYINAAGCDNLATLNLTITYSTSSTDSVGVHCDSYTWLDGITYTSSNNTATWTYTNAADCDSTVTLNLTINNSSTNSIGITDCNDYLWDGIVYDSTGSYTNLYTAGNGCDSSVTLNLTINNSTTNSVDATACNDYLWDGIVYDSTGSYTNVYADVNGCDSTVTLNLTINNSTTNSVDTTACNDYLWDGIVYDSTGSYTNTYTAVNGCDSIVTLTLTINISTSSIDDVGNHCDSYTWIDGVTYTTTNTTATMDYTNAAGCDSIVTLNLIINDNPVVSISSSNNILSAITTGGTSPYSYLWTGALNSTNAIVTPIASGDYCVQVTDANGCVSLEVCENVIINAINDLYLSKFNVYPNPTSDFVTLDFNTVIKGDYTVKIISSNGDQVYEHRILDFNGDYTKNINLSNLAKGNYIIQIHSDHQVVYRKILLQ
ncbi:T9SS type A sorting domain-containing protein [Flavobacteriales bacterium]|nr:T9SS type A sorting domain-containing protein [Flavobacteriales bacterium]